MTSTDEPENPTAPTRHEVGNSTAIFDRAAAELRGEPASDLQGIAAVPLTAPELRALSVLLESYPAARPPLAELAQRLAADIQQRWTQAAGHDADTPPASPVDKELQQAADRYAAARAGLGQLAGDAASTRHEVGSSTARARWPATT